METEQAPKRKRTQGIKWPQIEAALIAGESPIAVAKRHGITYNTLKVHVSRAKLVIPSQKMIRNVSKNMEKAVQSAAEKVAKSWLKKGEEHRELAFDVAHESIKKFKAKAPRSFRELEAADKIARRSAGLEVADVIQQTLVNVNEAINEFDQPQEIREATILQDVSPDYNSHIELENPMDNGVVEPNDTHDSGIPADAGSRSR